MGTAETVTLSKADYEALVERIEDLEDLVVLAERRGQPSLPAEAAKRLLGGESAVLVWRQERGLTQRALAEAAGLSPAMLNEIEKGKKTPSLPTAKALADALGLGLDDLYG